ncbi:MAG TPA: DUF1501 domain-containing protein [Candidatus Kapabacteria bacterium]|nr:DUF1501 domain-containing protein [Candidatus Kapabacteria bacterium]
MKRRSFLKTVPLGVAATAVPFMLGTKRAEALMHSPLLDSMSNTTRQDDHVLVIIFLEGGNDGLNTVIPFEDPLYDEHRKHLGFTTVQEKARLTFKLRGDLSMNPFTSALEPLWQEGKMAIVQNVGIENPDLSHFRGLDIWNSASDPDLLVPTGWAGRYLETLYPNYPAILPEDPVAINMGALGSQIFRGSNSMMDIQVHDPRTFSAAGNTSIEPVPQTQGGTELAYVRSLVNIANVYSARFHSLFPEKAVSNVTYPDTPFAQDLQRIAWCVNAGLKTKIYFASLQGFDTHFCQLSKDDSSGAGHAFLLRTFSEAVYAFQRDLEALGNADRVVTMTYSEFGRRVGEIGDYSSGTDHGAAAPHFIIGAKVNGELYGRHPDLGNLDKNGDLVNEFEFRRLYAAVLADWFGVGETLRQSLLTPGRPHDPFDISFPINGSAKNSHLIRSLYPENENAGAPRLMLYPNPAAIQTTLYLAPPMTSSVVDIAIFDVRGRQVATQQAPISQGNEWVTLDVQNLPNGSYFLRIRSETISQSLKLIVSH